MIGKQFITAGRAIFTIKVPDSFIAAMQAKGNAPCGHYTYRVRLAPATDRWPETLFVGYLTGPNNGTDYSPLGKLNPETGAVALVQTTTLNDQSWPVRILRRFLAALWTGRENEVLAAGFDFQHEGRCGRCGRRLTVPESIEIGLGPECASK